MSDTFAIGRTNDITIDRPPSFRDFYVLSPFVWREDTCFHLLVRTVNRSDVPSEKIARIYHGVGESPDRFALDREPAIAPGPENFDRDGCEDPTVQVDDGVYYVYYSGWNEETKRGELLFATGDDIHHLQKRGPVLTDTPLPQNAKETSIVRAADGSWRLFFEFAADNRSKIGLASAKELVGPWKIENLPFAAREASWDSWHLSPGPIWQVDGRPSVMFYNGADRDNRWRIGWIEFDSTFSNVTARGLEPLISPPPKEEPEDTDIAFVASASEAIEGGEKRDEIDSIALYYTVADRRPVRSVVKRTK